MKFKKNKKDKKPKETFDIDKKYIFAIVQIIFFLFIVFPMVIGLNNPIYVFPILILEFISFIPYIFKKSVRYSIIIWVIQFYIASLLNIIIQPASFFNVPEVSGSAALTLIFLLTIAVIPILILAFFKEKMIKPVLFGLSTGTTIVVILIVGFILMEGAPTFQKTSPIDFLTGEEWQLYTTRSYNQKETLTVIINNYDFLIIPEDENMFFSPSTNSSFNFEIKNIGAKEDHYFISYKTSYNLENISLKDSYINLAPNDKFQTTISFFSDELGKNNIELICKSNNSNITKSVNVSVIYSEHSLEFSPDIVSVIGTQDTARDIKYTLTNNGNFKENYIIKIHANSFFNPFVREIEHMDYWDYDNNSGNITIESGETVNLSISPLMFNKVVGDYVLYIEVYSEEYPEILDNSTINYQHVTKKIIEFNETEKTISPQDTAIFYLTASGGLNDVYVRFLNLSEEFNVQIEQSGKIVLNNTRKEKLNITQETKELIIYIKDNNLEDGREIELIFEIESVKEDLSLGALEFLIGSFFTTLIAIAIAAPLGIGVAVFLSEFCNKKIKPGLRFMYDLLAGIPSVVYGLFGFLTFGPLLGETVFPFIFGVDPSNGRCVLTASLILALMILPIIIALSEDAIQSVDKGLKQGSLAMGSTRWQMMTKVVLPKAKSGIIASIILAMGRAIGETMAVSMIMGGSIGMPDVSFPGFLFERVGTMTSQIALNFGWAVGFPDARAALFAMATLLFVIVFILNGIVFMIRKSSSKKRSRSNKYILKIFYCLKLPFIKFAKIIKISKKEKMLKEKTYKFSPQQIADYFKPSKIEISTKRSLRFQNIMKIILYVGSIFSTAMLLFIIGDIMFRGGTNIQLQDFFQPESILNPAKGGFANAIVGSLELVAVSLAVAAPLAIGAAIYIVEYAKKENIFTRIILFMSDTLASTPSIVFGAFGYVFFVFFLDFKPSLLVGGLTLGFMVIPLLLRSSIEALKGIPDSYREGSYALGATKWQTIQNVVMPPATPGVSSGVIISIGRAIGETAAIIFTAGYFRHFAQSILEPVGSMPNLIWNYYSESLSFPELGAKVYSAAMMLLIIVIILNIFAKIIAHRAKRMME